MTTYIALLRGVNVGGKKLAMSRLAATLTDLGYDDVTTYIQSGNAIFRTSRTSEPTLVRTLERAIAASCGLSPRVLVRTREQLARVEAQNPFLRKRVDPKTLHVTFLGSAPSARARAGLQVPPGPDELVVQGRAVYLRCPGGYGRTKLTNDFFERRLVAPATTRNWRTVTTLLDLADR